MKSHSLPTQQEIVDAFGAFNFGENCRTPEAKERQLASSLLQAASGYSCGSSVCRILVMLKLAKYKENIGYGPIKVTAYGRRCILSAHKLLMRHYDSMLSERKEVVICKLPKQEGDALGLGSWSEVKIAPNGKKVWMTDEPQEPAQWETGP